VQVDFGNHQISCGDGMCNGDETVWTCSEDCGAAPQCDETHPCGDGYTCIEGGCIIVCEEPLAACFNQYCANLQTDVDNCGECGNYCGDGFTCRGGQCDRIDTFSPYTEPACVDLLNNLRPMDDLDPSTLPMLDLHDTFVSASYHYVSRFDCVGIKYYTRGEPSFSADCTGVEWYNREQTQVHSYGGMPILTAPNPAGAICFLAVKNSPTEKSLPVTITITDSFNTKVDPIVSSDPVIERCFALPEDFSECRLRDAYNPFPEWAPH
jgi:hypothetical protein